MGRQLSTDAPKLWTGALGALRPLAEGEFEASDGDDLEAVELVGATYDELCWDPRRRLDGSRVREVHLDRWRARGAVITETRLESLDLIAWSAPETSWRDVALTDSRVGSAELFEANFRRVLIRGSKLGYLNLRDANLADVAFVDCIIEELDLMRAKAKRVSLAGCRIGRLELSGARLEHFDLRGAEFADLSGLDGLRGVTISADQLFDLAPILASRLGVKVE